MQFFFIINHSFKKFKNLLDEQVETKIFIDLLTGVCQGKSGDTKNFAKIFEYPVIEILWNSKGTPAFRGYAKSEDMRELVRLLKF